MASKRRGGLRTPELRGTLGTLLRTTTGVVRDALERGAREGRARLDDARAGRRRHDALADLGELVLDLIRRGEIDLAELPEARDLVRQLDELDLEADGEPEPPRSLRRSRFDDRATPTSDDRPRPSFTDRPRPASDDRPRSAFDDRARPSFTDRPRSRLGDDGTVSSGAVAAAARSARPTVPSRPKTADPRAAELRATKPIKGLWRPEPGAPALDDDPDPPPVPRRTPTPLDPLRKGGISFEDDDLDEYMHPDDVPPKATASEPDDGEA
jgi:hypothetical protein